MPIYRYRCTECGAQEEHLQKISDPPLETCEACGGALSKLMTAAAFHLKGGGWYKDLYSSSKSGQSESSSKSGAAGSKSSDSGSGSSSGSSSSDSASSGSAGSTSSSSSGSSSSTSTSAA